MKAIEPISATSHIRLLQFEEYLEGFTAANISLLLNNEEIDESALDKLLCGVLKNERQIFHGTLWHILYKNTFYPASISYKTLQLSNNRLINYVKKYLLISLEHINDSEIIDPLINKELIINTLTPDLRVISKLVLISFILLVAKKLRQQKYNDFSPQLSNYIESKIKILIPTITGTGKKFNGVARQKASNKRSEFCNYVTGILLNDEGLREIVKYSKNNNINQFKQLSRNQLKELVLIIGEAHRASLEKYKILKEMPEFDKSYLYMKVPTQKPYKSFKDSIGFDENPKLITGKKNYCRIRQFIESSFNIAVNNTTLSRYSIIENMIQEKLLYIFALAMHSQGYTCLRSYVFSYF